MIGDHRPKIMITKIESAGIENAQVSQITIGNDTALYIYVPLEDGLNHSIHALQKIQKEILDSFGKAFPNTVILVGFYDLKFTNITKKEEFSAKLSGNLPP